MTTKELCNAIRKLSSSCITKKLIKFSCFTDLPKFGEVLQNVTVPVGREAVLQCVVDNLQTYKVSCWLNYYTL